MMPYPVERQPVEGESVKGQSVEGQPVERQLAKGQTTSYRFAGASACSTRGLLTRDNLPVAPEKLFCASFKWQLALVVRAPFAIESLMRPILSRQMGHAPEKSAFIGSKRRL